MASSQQLRQEQLPHSHQQQQQQHKRQRHSIRFRSHSPPPPHKRRAIKEEDYEAAEEEEEKDVKKGRSIINNSINNNLNLRMPATMVADEKMAASVAAAAAAKLRNGQHQQLQQQQQNGHHPPKRNRQLRHQFSHQQLSLAAEKLAVPLAPAEVMATDGDGSSNGGGPHNQVYKLVLTGGPCGGKTTGQERLATFFEGLGWKVFTVPEAATILLNGRIRFQELNEEQAYLFQKDLLLTLLQVEQVFVNQANAIKDRNVLVICDRGALDPSAYMDQAAWDRLLGDIKKDVFDLRDNRYNQIVHMVTAADGAPKYYTCANNLVRSESMDQALNQDRRTREAWIGHQCLSIVDNSDCRNFNDKIMKLIKVVSERLGISYEDRLAKNSKKRKWLVTWVDEQAFRDNKFEEFSVTHSYLITTDNNNQQVRLRARFQNGRTTYTLTTRRYEASDGIKLPEPVETRKQLTRREYSQYLSMRDRTRIPVHKKRRCFVYGNVYFHLDTYVEPLPPACNGHPLMILETYTTRPVGDPEPQLPTFLTVDREITGEPAYSMYNLACRGSASSQNGTGIVMLQNDQ